MPVKPDHWIRRMARRERMIEPFEEGQVRQGRISYGTSSYGYDFRLGRAFQVPRFAPTGVVDPKKMDLMTFREVEAESFLLAPNSFVLGQSLEYFRIPRGILTICTGKSTYARCGVMLNVTPFEPEWEGHATLSIANTGPLPVRLYADEGIAQLIFLAADEECETSYADRKGKYQAQRTITTARVDGGVAGRERSA